jgi:alkylation response protein AidB-like acyl-CoA dehydrogenase
LAAIEDGESGDLQEAAGDDAYAEWYAALIGTGAVVPRWPLEAGGLGLDDAMSSRVERLLQESGIVRLNAFELNRIGAAIAGWGTERQRNQYLPGILKGTERWCQLFSEPSAGSDLPSLATIGAREGSGWKLNGQKVWTSGAMDAHHGLLLARTNPDLPKRAGLTCFIVQMTMPGVDIRPLRQMTGDSDFSEVFLNDVLVADSQRVGDVDVGWELARSVLAGERRGISGAGAGESTGFDVRITAPELGHPIGVARDRAIRLYIESVVHGWRNRRLAHIPNRAAASLGKLAQSELNQSGHASFISELGARGMACEVDDMAALAAQKGFLRSRANTIEGGTSEIHRNTVTEGLLALPREPDPYRSSTWRLTPR